jgi:hypothetical protein
MTKSHIHQMTDVIAGVAAGFLHTYAGTNRRTLRMYNRRYDLGCSRVCLVGSIRSVPTMYSGRIVAKLTDQFIRRNNRA